MAPISLRAVRPVLPICRSRIVPTLPGLIRLYSSKKKGNSLATSRPELLPEARRKQFQDSNIDLYPRINNSGKIQSFEEFTKNFHAIDVGVIDDTQMITVRGVYRTHCSSFIISTQLEIIRDIMYYCCKTPQKSWEIL